MPTQEEITEMLDELIFKGKTVQQIEKECGIGKRGLIRHRSGSRLLSDNTIKKFILYYEEKIGRKDIIENESRWDELEKKLDSKIK